jgi:hypothetical protein
MTHQRSAMAASPCATTAGSSVWACGGHSKKPSHVREANVS